jgi:hypothetical protein
MDGPSELVFNKHNDLVLLDVISRSKIIKSKLTLDNLVFNDDNNLIEINSDMIAEFDKHSDVAYQNCKAYVQNISNKEYTGTYYASGRMKSSGIVNGIRNHYYDIDGPNNLKARVEMEGDQLDGDCEFYNTVATFKAGYANNKPNTTGVLIIGENKYVVKKNIFNDFDPLSESFVSSVITSNATHDSVLTDAQYSDEPTVKTTPPVSSPLEETNTSATISIAQTDITKLEIRCGELETRLDVFTKTSNELEKKNLLLAKSNETLVTENKSNQEKLSELEKSSKQITILNRNLVSDTKSKEIQIEKLQSDCEKQKLLLQKYQTPDKELILDSNYKFSQILNVQSKLHNMFYIGLTFQLLIIGYLFSF